MHSVVAIKKPNPCFILCINKKKDPTFWKPNGRGSSTGFPEWAQICRMEGNSGVGLREEGGKAVIKEPTDKDPSLIFRSIMLCHLMLWASDLPSCVHPPCLRNVKNSWDQLLLKSCFGDKRVSESFGHTNSLWMENIMKQRPFKEKENTYLLKNSGDFLGHCSFNETWPSVSANADNRLFLAV